MLQGKACITTARQYHSSLVIKQCAPSCVVVTLAVCGLAVNVSSANTAYQGRKAWRFAASSELSMIAARVPLTPLGAFRCSSQSGLRTTIWAASSELSVIVARVPLTPLGAFKCSSQSGLRTTIWAASSELSVIVARVPLTPLGAFKCSSQSGLRTTILPPYGQNFGCSHNNRKQGVSSLGCVCVCV